MRTNKAVRVKKYEWEGRHEREGKGTSSRVPVKEYQGHEDMKTTTKERIQEYESRRTKRKDKDMSAVMRQRVQEYESRGSGVRRHETTTKERIKN